VPASFDKYFNRAGSHSVKILDFYVGGISTRICPDEIFVVLV